ncbi:hypothetical protein PASE110613_09030 [Paenibacillus sediminis]|uniref:Uncharacterized protein n=1 Tax=Paenibacillus sediminis TaxID=664909 RepID=A0ABS4H6W1_9BACL|nr:hypothetical protein [Paenibacillus sediminis]MBP1938211.1 hypothetical protein [Paenibacillus sediminis]
MNQEPKKEEDEDLSYWEMFTSNKNVASVVVGIVASILILFVLYALVNGIAFNVEITPQQ